jgi:hypothetical protein
LIKKEILTLILIPAISIVIALSIFLNFVKLSDISTAIASAAVGAIVLLSSWGFRHRFEKSNPKLAIVYDETNIDQYTPIDEQKRQKYLRIQVKNDGDGFAEDCEALLTVTKNFDSRYPTTEEKFLQWTKYNVTKLSIPKHDYAYLCIVFSTRKNIHGQVAYVSTPQSSDPKIPPRFKDGLRAGNYIIKLRIKSSRLNNPLIVKFELYVKENWKQLSMKKID